MTHFALFRSFSMASVGTEVNASISSRVLSFNSWMVLGLLSRKHYTVSTPMEVWGCLIRRWVKNFLQKVQPNAGDVYSATT